MSDPTTATRRAAAIRALERRRRFHAHVAVHAVLLAVLAIVWAISEYHNAGGWPTGLATGRDDRDWDPWIVYPVLVAATAVAVHAWHLYGRRPITEEDIRREMATRRPG